MARLIIALPAQADTVGILIDLADKAGRAVSSEYAKSFERLQDRLIEHPDSGAPRPRLGRHIRICVVAPYVVIYEHVIGAEIVRILRVIHGRRKLTRKLLRGV